VWNQGRVETIDEMLAPDCVGHGLVGPDGVEVTSVDAFKEFHRTFKSAFPDMRIDVEHTISEGDCVAARCSVRATHTGHGLGIAPAGKQAAFGGVNIMRIRDGKIVESWNHFDMLTLFKQIDAM
jgi:steroid delta-isomerase-like uncharacterized protein